MTNPTSTPPDDFETVKIIVSALQNFQKEDQQRILRWAQEKLSLIPAQPSPPAQQTAEQQRVSRMDIKTFMEQKKPQSDIEFAAAVAYYYRFEAPENERKEEISTVDLQDAARKVPRERLKRPIYTLHNAFKGGLLDKGSTKGSFKINTVGENLVAMTLPFGKQEKSKRIIRPVRKRAKIKTSTKRR